MTDPAHETALEAAAEIVERNVYGMLKNGANVSPVTRAAIAAYLAHMEAAGRKMVAQEATEEMVQYGAAALDHPSVYMGGPSQGNRRRAAAAWNAMFDAAQPKQEG